MTRDPRGVTRDPRGLSVTPSPPFTPRPCSTRRYRSQPAPFIHAAFPHHLHSPPDGLHLLPAHGHPVPASSQPAGPTERSRLAGLRPVQPAAWTGKAPTSQRRSHRRDTATPGGRSHPLGARPSCGDGGTKNHHQRVAVGICGVAAWGCGVRCGGDVGCDVVSCSVGCRHPALGVLWPQMSVGIGLVLKWSRRFGGW